MSINIFREKNIIIGFFLLFTIILTSGLGAYINIGDKVKYLFPLLAILAFTEDSKTLTKNAKEFLLLLIIFLLSFSTAFYYVNYDSFISSLNLFFLAILAAYISTSLNKNKDYSTIFHLGYIIGILCLVIIIFKENKFSQFNFASQSISRDEFIMNANYYSYISYFANFSLFYLHNKYKSWLTLVSIIVIPLLFIALSFITQSRSGLYFLVLINLVYWIYINKISTKNIFYSLFNKTILLTTIVIIAFQLFHIYETSNIRNRVEYYSNNADIREELIYRSIDVFLDNPILGAGIGQVAMLNGIGQFSHNSFIEIVSEQGIIGGILLLILFWLPLKKSIAIFKSDPNNVLARTNLLFFVTFYLFNNLYPFYKFSFSMMYFFLIISIQNKIILKK